MMRAREVARRLRAWEAGAPVPRYNTLHHAVAPPEHVLVVAFVRMAGESRPWGIAWGRPDTNPRIESVPDGRVRDDVATLAASFAEDILAHLRIHNWTYDPLTKGAGPEELRQVWVPNGQHVAMLHQLAYAYTQTKFGGVDRETLNALGRLAGWLFRESTRRGCQHLIDASAALREAHVFPAEDARQAHLGFLLAWLTTSGDRDARIAAASAAEALPVSPTMDPTLERRALEKPLERRRDLLRAGGAAPDEEAEVQRVLHGELLHRWTLCIEAYQVLASDARPVNPGVEALIRAGLDECYWQCQAPELKIADPSQGQAYISHPETDFHGSSAASRYLVYASADEKYLNTLIHHDNELFAEALQDGRALCGEVLDVRDDGQGRVTRPVWRVRLDIDTVQPIREGARVTPRGSPRHWAVVIFLDQDPTGITVELEWNGNKSKSLRAGIDARPIDNAWVGQRVNFVSSDSADLTLRRSQRVWKAKDGPGGWLTHGRPHAPIIADIASDTPEVIVDDAAQIEEASGQV